MYHRILECHIAVDVGDNITRIIFVVSYHQLRFTASGNLMGDL